jgi:hypothetical protein
MLHKRNYFNSSLYLKVFYVMKLSDTDFLIFLFKRVHLMHNSVRPGMVPLVRNQVWKKKFEINYYIMMHFLYLCCNIVGLLFCNALK